MERAVHFRDMVRRLLNAGDDVLAHDYHEAYHTAGPAPDSITQGQKPPRSTVALAESSQLLRPGCFTVVFVDADKAEREYRLKQGSQYPYPYSTLLMTRNGIDRQGQWAVLELRQGLYPVSRSLADVQPTPLATD